MVLLELIIEVGDGGDGGCGLAAGASSGSSVRVIYKREKRRIS